MNYSGTGNPNSFVTYNIFRPFLNLMAFTTTRSTLETINPRFTGDSSDLYENSRELLAEKLGISPKQLIFPRQTHSCTIAEISSVPNVELADTDALITSEKEICICVQTADCVPILIFDKKENIISATHAGWRGTVNGIVETTVFKMINTYKSKPENLLAAIGPSIGPEVYEVGDEVVEAVLKTLPDPDQCLIKNKTGKFHFDLWKANRQLLLRAGLTSDNIQMLEKCTFSENDLFYSARKNGVQTGRLVSGMMLLK